MLTIRSFFVLLLGFFSLVFVFSIEEYNLVGNKSLFTSDFSNDMKSWYIPVEAEQTGLVNIVDGKLVLNSSSITSSPMITINKSLPFPEKGGLVKVTVEASIKDIVKGEKSWYRARVLLFSQLDETNLWIDKEHKHIIYTMSGSKSMSAYQQVIPIHSSADKLEIYIQVPTLGGTMNIKSILIQSVNKNQLFYEIRNILLMFRLIILSMGSE